uniref:Histone-lysine N-methyltransferase H3 lysine-9 specific SUVH4 n=1 Tax=Rhizophora mucronata TaxID=61149 RepID=A0A2P2JUX8_RHIMU
MNLPAVIVARFIHTMAYTRLLNIGLKRVYLDLLFISIS